MLLSLHQMNFCFYSLHIIVVTDATVIKNNISISVAHDCSVKEYAL